MKFLAAGLLVLFPAVGNSWVYIPRLAHADSARQARIGREEASRLRREAMQARSGAARMRNEAAREQREMRRQAARERVEATRARRRYIL